MSMKIMEDCINCGACEEECPNDAIDEGDDTYLVNPELCTECVGAHDEPKCIELCPIDDCILPDATRAESREDLRARYERLHHA